MRIKPHLHLVLIAVVGLISSPAGAATYYLDDIGGSDGNNGTSSNTAWQNLSKASAKTFQPGDRLLLKSGGTWTGELDLNGDGTLANPIVVDRYGAGAKPFIDGGGYESAVRLQGVSCWEVNNLELINNGGTNLSGAADFRAGVLVESAFTAVRRHIYLRNLTIHDIFPATGAFGHGIYVVAECSPTVGTYYDDVRIENCQISRTGRFGVQVHQTGSTQTAVTNRFIRNVIIRNNTFTNTGGSGAETGWCSDILLESNIVHNSGASVDPRQWARGSGYWPFKCTNVLVQFNQFRHARGEADSCGVHIDFGNRDVTIQYNLSLDNEGGFVEILGDCLNSIYRYNVSINDGARVKGVNGADQDGHLIWLSDYVGGGPGIGSSNSMIYNNTVYVRPGMTNHLKIMATTVDTFIRNNIFIINGKSIYTNAGTNTVFQNNLWHGNVPVGVPTGSGSILTNPQVALPGGTNASNYLISGTSPAIAAGLVITNNGGLDYWGNPLPPGPPCIGAHQREYVDPGVISVNFTATTNTAQQVGAGVSYGVPAQNSLVSGWLNLNQTFTANNLPFDNGAASLVDLSGSTSGGWSTGNSAYNGSPLVAGAGNNTNSAGPTSFTLQNLKASFPQGYKIIVYLSGFVSNTGAYITDGRTTNFYQPLAAPVAPVPLVQTLVTNNPGSGNNPVAQYAVFGAPNLLTNNSVTISLKALSGGGVILGGFQVRSTGEFTAQGVPHGWFAAFGIPINDLGDQDLDAVPAWQEFYAGTSPTNSQSLLKIIDVSRAGQDLQISWLGGITGWQGNWSMSVSSNLTDWSRLTSKSIPRGASGTNMWTHTNGIGAATTKFYRPTIE
jgi:hypothetical protein